jgi:hypothetical protein
VEAARREIEQICRKLVKNLKSAADFSDILITFELCGTKASLDLFAFHHHIAGA